MNETTDLVVPSFTARKRGRPSKSEVDKKKNPGVVGRPKGDAARMAEFKARLMATNGGRVIDKVIQIALNDDHPAQAACLKMCWDRLLPITSFERDVGRPGGISINITTDTGTVVVSAGTPKEEEAIDVEDVAYTEIAREDASHDGA